MVAIQAREYPTSSEAIESIQAILKKSQKFVNVYCCSYGEGYSMGYGLDDVVSYSIGY